MFPLDTTRTTFKRVQSRPHCSFCFHIISSEKFKLPTHIHMYNLVRVPEPVGQNVKNLEEKKSRVENEMIFPKGSWHATYPTKQFQTNI